MATVVAGGGLERVLRCSEAREHSQTYPDGVVRGESGVIDRDVPGVLAARVRDIHVEIGLEPRQQSGGYGGGEK
ncbi:hypothetical protein F6B41_15170 [Microbacterium lushaniae]|nr:hypothetical protein F6B41_15170 [Microbacterium lushaniae]